MGACGVRGTAWYYASVRGKPATVVVLWRSCCFEAVVDSQSAAFCSALLLSRPCPALSLVNGPESDTKHDQSCLQNNMIRTAHRPCPRKRRQKPLLAAQPQQQSPLSAASLRQAQPTRCWFSCWRPLAKRRLAQQQMLQLWHRPPWPPWPLSPLWQPWLALQPPRPHARAWALAASPPP